MSKLFLSILSMSLTSSYVILFVVFVRVFLKKAPKYISYALWSVVAFRLIIPFSFESIFSLLPQNTVPIQQDIISQQSSYINSGIESVDTYVKEILPVSTAGDSVNWLQVYIQIGGYIWILGMMALLVYSFASVRLLNGRLKNAKFIEQNIYEAANIKTPFVLGLIRPKIYLPIGLSKEERGYILHHEQTHIKRNDHIIKLFAFLILSIHWFNPLIWIAFMLMGMDMELSCDERVLKELNSDIRKPYATSLLTLATERRILNGSPLAFGEGNVKGRIKNVLNYKKPRFWIVAVALVTVVAVCIGLLTNPQSISLLNAGVVQTIEMEQFNDGSSLGSVTVIDHVSIENVLSNLTGAKKTMISSVNDSPTQNNYLKIRLMLPGESRTLFLYSDNGRHYIEEPYMGVYKSNRVRSTVIYKIYTENISTTQNIDNLGSSARPLEDNAKGGILVPTSPKVSPEQIVGTDMAELDYASDDIVIFHGYFGLFVYDLNSLQIIRSLDLKPLNCHQTQGDNYCDVSVSMDGNTVQLHPMSSKNMYIYTVSSHTLQETTYKPMENPFRSQFVSTEKVINSTLLGTYSYNAVRFDRGEFGYLRSDDQTLGTLSYVREDMIYTIFDKSENNEK